MRLTCATLAGIAVFSLAEAWWQPGRFCTGAFAPRKYVATIGRWEFGIKSYNALSQFGPRTLFPIDVRHSVFVAGSYVQIHLAYVLAALMAVAAGFAAWFGWHLLPPR